MAVLPSQRPQGQLPRHSRQLESVRRLFPLVAVVVQHHIQMKYLVLLAGWPAERFMCIEEVYSDVCMLG